MLEADRLTVGPWESPIPQMLELDPGDSKWIVLRYPGPLPLPGHLPSDSLVWIKSDLYINDEAGYYDPPMPLSVLKCEGENLVYLPERAMPVRQLSEHP